MSDPHKARRGRVRCHVRVRGEQNEAGPRRLDPGDRVLETPQWAQTRLEPSAQAKERLWETPAGADFAPGSAVAEGRVVTAAPLALAPSHGRCSAGLTELTSEGVTREQRLPRLVQLALLGRQAAALGPASPAPPRKDQAQSQNQVRAVDVNSEQPEAEGAGPSPRGLWEGHGRTPHRRPRPLLAARAPQGEAGG